MAAITKRKTNYHLSKTKISNKIIYRLLYTYLLLFEGKRYDKQKKIEIFEHFWKRRRFYKSENGYEVGSKYGKFLPIDIRAFRSNCLSLFSKNTNLIIFRALLKRKFIEYQKIKCTI